MIYNYDRSKSRIALSGPGAVEKWRSDLRRMTKIYKSVETAPEEKQHDILLEARGYFIPFRKNFEVWVFDEVLPSRDAKKQDWWEQKVAKAAWDAQRSIESSLLFPSSWNYKTEQYEPSVHAMVSIIEKNVTHYQRAFNLAFKALDELFQERARKGKESLKPVELLHVGPIQVVVHNQGRDEQYNPHKALEDELGNLVQTVHRIEHAGFPQAVKGLTVHISFVSIGMRSGLYDPSKDELTLYPLSTGHDNNETLIHECGHRFYFKVLPANARAHWKEVIDARALTLEDSDIDHWVDKYIKPEVTNGFLPERHELLQKIHEGSLELESKCRDLVEHTPAFTKDPEEIRDFLKKHYKGKRVNLEEITDYATGDEKEAFAEAFMLYVLHGPGALGPWTQNFFKIISHAGGAKLARIEDPWNIFYGVAPSR